MQRMARFVILLVLVAVWINVAHAIKPAEPAVQAAMRNLVDSLPHARRRALLQNEDEAGCVWDANNKKCTVNPVTALGFLEKAPESSLKDLILNTLVGDGWENGGL